MQKTTQKHGLLFLFSLTGNFQLKLFSGNQLLQARHYIRYQEIALQEFTIYENNKNNVHNVTVTNQESTVMVSQRKDGLNLT